MKMYALRHKESGKFSEGGRYAAYLANHKDYPPKLWTSMNKVMQFIKWLINDKRLTAEHNQDIPKWRNWTPQETLKGYEIVEVTLDLGTTKDVSELVEEVS